MIIQDQILDLKTSVRKTFDLRHKISGINGKNSTQIQVPITQEKKLQLGLFISTEVRSIHSPSKL